MNDDVPFGFDALVVVFQMAEKRIVVGVENQPRQFAHHREDVTRTGSIFASLNFIQFR